MIAVVASHVVAGDRRYRWFIQQTLARDPVVAIVFGCFSTIHRHTDESAKDGYTVYQEIGRKDYRKTEKTGFDETCKVLD